MKIKKALIFGIGGQDVYYLANFLIKKKYKVDGVSKSLKFKNLKLLKIQRKIKIFKYPKKMDSLLKKNYDEIYFLGGQSNVFKSFSNQEMTYNSQIQPIIPILEHIRMKKIKSKFLYASSSEIFGNYKNRSKKNENSFKQPVSPYGLSKLIGFEIIKSYREMFKIPVCSVIFFNHESPLRSKEYVIKKIIDYLKSNKRKKLKLGNINIKRDWGWGPEFVQACHKILTSKEIDDYVIASGKTHSLKNVLKEAFLLKNLNYKQFVVSDQRKKRKFDINQNYADIKKIKSKLDWKPRVNLKKIIFRMYNYEY